MILSEGIQTTPNEPDYMHITFAQLTDGEIQKREDWEIINNPFSPDYQRNTAIKKLEELTGKKINELTK